MINMPNKQIVHTVYVRVLKWKAFQVEIHPIKLSSTSCQLETTAWFQDRHMQEVLMLLKNIMQERAMLKSKDVDAIKSAKSEILTGSSVRLGYSFKQKEQHQICLLPADFSDQHHCVADDVTPRYRNLVLHSEKLVVYTYPLESSSQQNMLQLLSHQSQNPKVSISNYFQKTSSTVSSSQTATKPETSKTSGLDDGTAISERCLTAKNKSSSTVSDDPLSTRRKRTIKSIIKNSGPKLSNTKKRKTLKTGVSSSTKAGEPTQQKLYTKQISASKNMSCRSEDKKPEIGEIKDKDWYFDRVEKCVTERSDYCASVHPGSSRTCAEKIDPLVSKDTKMKTRYRGEPSSDCDDLTLQTSQQEKNHFCSVTAHSGQACTRNATKMCLENNSDQVINAMNDELLSDHPSHSELNVLKEKRHCTRDRDGTDSMFKTLSPVKVTKEADKESDLCYTSDQSSASSQPSGSEITLTLPEIPFLKSKCLSVSMLRKIADYKNIMLKSPKSVTSSLKNTKNPFCSNPFNEPYEFESSPKKTKKENKRRDNTVQQKCLGENVNKTTVQNSNADKSQMETEFAAKENLEKLPAIFCKKRDRWKKRLTEIFPLSEESVDSVAAETLCCVNTEATENDAAKETEDGVIWISENETHLKDRLSAQKRVSQLSTSRSLVELTRELKQTKRVDNIGKPQLEKLVLSYEPYLKDLFQGQGSCWRHQEYKKGGTSRANLNHYVHFGLFTEEQQDVVMETLMSIFCKKHHKYLDYIMKVLLPEILIKILMEMKELSHNEADRLLATTQL